MSDSSLAAEFYSVMIIYTIQTGRVVSVTVQNILLHTVSYACYKSLNRTGVPVGDKKIRRLYSAAKYISYRLLVARALSVEFTSVTPATVAVVPVVSTTE